jgi:hypothetical protein
METIDFLNKSGGITEDDFFKVWCTALGPDAGKVMAGLPNDGPDRLKFNVEFRVNGVDLKYSEVTNTLLEQFDELVKEQAKQYLKAKLFDLQVKIESLDRLVDDAFPDLPRSRW